MSDVEEHNNHNYFRPSWEETSGYPENDKKYHRSPCPALNTLANHGYLPRDGKNLTRDLVKPVLIKQFNLDSSAAERLVQLLPEDRPSTLADLSKHNYVEHDASLVHDDAYFKNDPAKVNDELANALLSKADKENKITPSILAAWRKERETFSAKNNPEYSFTWGQTFTAYIEAAVLLDGLGDSQTETISVDHAKSFLIEEKFPDKFQPSKSQITLGKISLLAAKLKFLAWWK